MSFGHNSGDALHDYFDRISNPKAALTIGLATIATAIFGGFVMRHGVDVSNAPLALGIAYGTLFGAGTTAVLAGDHLIHAPS